MCIAYGRVEGSPSLFAVCVACEIACIVYSTCVVS